MSQEHQCPPRARDRAHAALYRVTLHPDWQTVIPGLKTRHLEPAKMPAGWRVRITDAEVIVTSPPAPSSIGDDSAAALERAALGIEPGRCCVVTSIPRHLCVLQWVGESEWATRGSDAPSLDLLAERLAAALAVETPPVVEAAQEPPLPAPRPPRPRVPPGGKAPVVPPPSVIVMDEGGAL